jgi:hypothetical protein
MKIRWSLGADARTQEAHVAPVDSELLEDWLLYYQQIFDERVAVPTGPQGLDLFPGLKAILIQVGWRF